MNQLSLARRTQIVKCLVEGNSIRATVRLTGAAKNTIANLLVDLGDACLDYQDRTLRDLPCKRLELDEIWSFCYAKEKHVPQDHRGEFGYGDVWTWTAIDALTKLVPCWHVGWRTAGDAVQFINDLAGRLSGRVQVTTDGLKVYIEAISGAFGWGEVDYAMLVKIYGPDAEAPEKRYSPPVCLAAEKTPVMGQPDEAYISTSYVERQNLTMRMSMRRFTRLTNGFSKKVENHMAAIALHFMHYNFARPHTTLTKQHRYPTTPAMVAGVADHVWKTEEIVGLLG